MDVREVSLFCWIRVADRVSVGVTKVAQANTGTLSARLRRLTLAYRPVLACAIAQPNTVRARRLIPCSAARKEPGTADVVVRRLEPQRW